MTLDPFQLTRHTPSEQLDVTNKRGIYFWFDRESKDLVYIGIAVGKLGLKGRIINQHLNPNYLEYRDSKQSSKDQFQLSHAKCRISKESGEKQKGIDKSSFRKSIGRNMQIAPGESTVHFIKEHLLVSIYYCEDINAVKNLEKELINIHQPKFNTSHKKQND